MKVLCKSSLGLNMNLLQSIATLLERSYVNVCKGYNSLEFITEPIRITSTSFSLTDQMYYLSIR